MRELMVRWEVQVCFWVLVFVFGGAGELVERGGAGDEAFVGALHGALMSLSGDHHRPLKR